jgi:hypothetical protein
VQRAGHQLTGVGAGDVATGLAQQCRNPGQIARGENVCGGGIEMVLHRTEGRKVVLIGRVRSHHPVALGIFDQRAHAGQGRAIRRIEPVHAGRSLIAEQRSIAIESQAVERADVVDHEGQQHEERRPHGKQPGPHRPLPKPQDRDHQSPPDQQQSGIFEQGEHTRHHRRAYQHAPRPAPPCRQ